MTTYRLQIARSFVPLSTRLRPLRGLDEAILVGLLRATGAVDTRHGTARGTSAVDVSARWLPAQTGAAAGDVPSATEAERESQLESAGLAIGSGGPPR
jgi:hypothetical protein